MRELFGAVVAAAADVASDEDRDVGSDEEELWEPNLSELEESGEDDGEDDDEGDDENDDEDDEDDNEEDEDKEEDDEEVDEDDDEDDDEGDDDDEEDEESDEADAPIKPGQKRKAGTLSNGRPAGRRIKGAHTGKPSQLPKRPAKGPVVPTAKRARSQWV